MDSNGVFGEILEQGKSTVQNVQKGVQQGVTQTAKTAVGQVTGSNLTTQQGSNEQASVQQQKMSDDQAKQFLKDLYGPTKPAGGDLQTNDPKPPTKSVSNQNLIQQVMGITPKDPNAGKSPEELIEIKKLTNELHGQYYQNLVNPQKPTEESVTEKLDREEKEEKFEEIEKQKEKPDPLATQKTGTGEKMVGVSG